MLYYNRSKGNNKRKEGKANGKEKEEADGPDGNR